MACAEVGIVRAAGRGGLHGGVYEGVRCGSQGGVEWWVLAHLGEMRGSGRG